MIGIIDYSFIKIKRGLPNPSLDAMKMAAYIKKELKQSVHLITNLDLIPNYEIVHFFTNERLEDLPIEITSVLYTIPILIPASIPKLIVAVGTLSSFKYCTDFKLEISIVTFLIIAS